MNSKFQSRCIVLCLLLVSGLSALSYRLVDIQLVNRRHGPKGLGANYQIEKLPAIRGMIVDRNEEPIAKTIPLATISIDRYRLDDADTVSWGLAAQEASATKGWAELSPKERTKRIRTIRGVILARDTPEIIVQKHLAYAIGVLARPLGLRREELREKIEGNKLKFFPVAKSLPIDLADRVRDAIEENGIEGFVVENSIKRWYTAPEIAPHLIGFTGEVERKGEDDKPLLTVEGRFGVEKTMETYLAGKDGWRKHWRNSSGLVVSGEPSSLMPPRAGLNVQLTLDMGLQAIVEDELDAGLKEFEAGKGCAILMDPKTGEVLAMANRPHFNLNHKENIAQNGWNYALQTTYEPGSTIKVVATAGALNEGLVTPTTMIFCHNGYFQSGSAAPVKDSHPAGTLSFEGVLEKSNNIGTYKMALQLGANRFYDYMDRWGFGKKTGILLSDESRGSARNTGNPSDFSRASFGYATAVTPLQIACAYTVIAGDGNLRKPKIVRALVANDGSIIQKYEPEIVANVLKPATAKKMRTALTRVTGPGGTAKAAAVEGFKVAGKTGTANKFNPKGSGYLDGHYIVSFVGMMPADDPAFVCAVVVDDPRTTKVNHYGGSVAGPIFKKIAERVAVRMNLQPTEPVKSPLATSESR